MEPLSALGIAAAGVQFVDFATKVLCETREIYKSSSGQTEKVLLLTRVTNDLTSLTIQVEKKAAALPQDPPPGSADAIFLDCCRQCKTVSDELAGILRTMGAKHPSKSKLKSAGSSFAAAFRSVASGNKIENLNDKLQTIQKQMHTAALVCLWEQARKNGETTLDVSQRLVDMVAALDRVEATTKQVATNLRDTAKGYSETRSWSTPENRGRIMHTLWATTWTPSRYDSPTNAGWTQADEETARAAILNSLLFDSMGDRQATIPKAYAETFEWLFKPQPVQVCGQPTAWSSFLAWLEKDTRDIYWITGKPGAGKSTLMKFLTADPRLRQHLTIWSESLQLLMSSFYFWNAGNAMQRSHEALMRTLLFQCLEQRPDVTFRVCQRRWACLQMLGLSAPDSFPDWEWEELVDCFKTLVSLTGNDFRIALFIDGLDEFDGDHNKLVETIRDLSQWDGLKICVSSRPWNVFSDAFKQSPSLMVQDLTRHDIQRYVRGNLEAQPAFGELQAGEPDQAERLVQDIVSRADGVFLWVAVVVRKLCQHLRDGDTLSALSETLHKLPQDLEKLFEAIRRQIDPKHVSQSSQYFLLLLEPRRRPRIPSLSATTLLLADEDEESSVHREFSKMCENRQDWMLATMKRRLRSRTMGLLEISPRGTVGFFHRTVLEWVTQKDNLGNIKRDASPGFNPSLELCKARITELLNARVHPESSTAMSSSQENIPAPGKTGGPVSPRTAPEFWQWVFVCLRHAALAAGHDANGDARVVQMLDTLVKKLPAVIESGGSAFATNHFGFFSSIDSWPESQLARLVTCSQVCRNRHQAAWHQERGYHRSFVRLAAKFGIAAYVKANVEPDKHVLGEELLQLLRNIILGHLEVASFERYTDPSLLSIKSPVPLLYESRIELTKHLLRIAPHDKSKRFALAVLSGSELKRHQEGRWASSRDKEYLEEVAHLLRKELSLVMWVWRYLVKGPRGVAPRKPLGK